jgi:hypothetical protein
MKKVSILVMVALLAMLILVPMAVAQTPTPSPSPMASPAGQVPESGGPAILLPAAALLLGSGILTYAILRRR